ncbi:MAG: hypothetical protein SFV54_12630 [Bryobacteraceae bacterium]|nr:hypothetical protein [Bryobacteraceae bacterium]
MNILRREQLEELARVRGSQCVSIYLPTHMKSRETRQDPIRFKNLVKRAESDLEAVGLRAAEAREMLEPANRLVDDYEFWQHQGLGLAVFASPLFYRHYRVPVEVPELVLANDRFHLKPLMTMLTGDGRFFILALGGNQLRLLECSRFGYRRVPLPEGVPESFTEAMKFVNADSGSKLANEDPNRPPVSYITSASDTDRKGRFLEYYRAVDRGLWPLLREEQAPLVLACVEHQLPIYKEANTYKNLIDEVIRGNPEGRPDDELYQAGQGIVQPIFERAMLETAVRFRSMEAAGKGSEKIPEVVAAAHQGRVDTLFVGLGLQHWGRFDPSSYQVELHREAQPGDEDLLDFAALQTLLHGGRVYALDPDKVPDKLPLAAIYRY